MHRPVEEPPPIRPLLPLAWLSDSPLPPTTLAYLCLCLMIIHFDSPVISSHHKHLFPIDLFFNCLIKIPGHMTFPPSTFLRPFFLSSVSFVSLCLHCSSPLRFFLPSLFFVFFHLFYLLSYFYNFFPFFIFSYSLSISLSCLPLFLLSLLPLPLPPPLAQPPFL